MSFLAPTALWLLALLPVVVALHFLRARRRRYEVPALFLWERAQTALARRRRFSPTWLLVAQLLFVTLAALALARPVVGESDRPDRVIVVDASASMTAPEGAGTRLDLARRGAQGLISGAGRVALIRAGVGASLLAPLDAEAGDLAAALDSLQAGDAAGDLLGALDLANSLLPGAEVHVFTDLEAAFGTATVHRVGSPVENVGISAFDIGIGQAFVAVVASGARPAEVEVELRQGERQLARGSVLVPGGGTGSITFPLTGVSGVVEARLHPPPGDALAIDDVAYAGSRALAVVSNDDYAPLMRALTAVPQTEVGVARDAAFRTGFDLKVVQREGASGLPPGNYLLFPPRAEEPEYQVIRDWDRADPLLRFVDLREVVVGLAAEREPWEEEGWEVLARTAELTPVMRFRQDEEGTILQLAFHPSQSDVVLRPAFPALIANLLGRLDTTTRIRLGEPLPGGTEPVLQPGVYGQEAVERTEAGGEGGAAEVAAGRGLVHASLLAAGESRLPERATELAGWQPPTGAGAADRLQAAAPGERAARSGAPTLAALLLLGLAFVALLAEWLLYSGRRLGGGGGLGGSRTGRRQRRGLVG